MNIYSKQYPWYVNRMVNDCFSPVMMLLEMNRQWIIVWKELL